MWLGWRQRHSAGAARRQPPERLGGREDSVLRTSARAAVTGVGAHSPLTQLFHLADDADAEGSGNVAAARHWSPTQADVTLTRPFEGPAAEHGYRSASLPRGGGPPRDPARWPPA